jgi:hypothetical protein
MTSCVMDAGIISRNSVIKQLQVNTLVLDEFRLPENALTCIKDFMFYPADVSVSVNLLRRVVLPFMRQISVTISDVPEVQDRENTACVVRQFVGEHTAHRVYGAKNHSMKYYCLQCGNYCRMTGVPSISCTCTNPYYRERLTSEAEIYYAQHLLEEQQHMYDEYDEYDQYDQYAQYEVDDLFDYDIEAMIEEEYAEEYAEEQRMLQMEGLGCY